MSKNIQNFFLLLLTISTIFPKWIYGIINFDNSVIVNTLFNFKDIQYLPIIISISDFIFNPTYLGDYSDNKIISFPIYGIFLHALFFKVFGVYSLIALEFILQLIFLIILLNVVNKIFKNFDNSLYFCIFVFLFISLIEIILINENTRYLKLIFDLLDQNLGTRFPRPLFTGIIYFYFFYMLYDLKNKLEKVDLKYFILLFFLLSIFLNSFFYYFFNFSILIILLSIRFLKKNFFSFFNQNGTKIILVTCVFMLSSLPFLLQLYLGESDYSERIGVFDMNLEKKLFLLKYYFLNLLRIEFLILLIPSLIIHLYLNKNFLISKNQIDKLNIYFYFLIASIIAPPIFFMISPKLISIYHFLGVLIFAFIFYLILSVSFILSQKIMIKKVYKDNYKFKVLLILIIFLSNIYVSKSIFSNNKNQINEIQYIQKFLIDNELINSDKKLFTNDYKIMNLWLLNENKQLAISDGFTNSLKNDQIEFNLLNNLKHFGITSADFKKIISYEKPEIRNDLLMRLFSYKYQANSLYTYSDLNEYHVKLKDRIKNTSPFRVQQQIFPEIEKERFLKNFINFKVNKSLLSEIVIIEKNENLKDFKMKNERYKLMFSLENYDLYFFKNKKN